MKFNKLTPLLLLGAILLGSLLFTACDKREGKATTYSIVQMTVEPDTIYSDNNTWADVSVFVKDNSGLPATGQTVLFTSSIGRIDAKVTTDSMGVATATFWGSGQTGTSLITAIIGETSATRPCQVNEPPAVSDISITSNTNIMTVGGAQSFTATVTDADGNDVNDGTLVTFRTTKGYFYDIDDSSSLGTRTIASTTNGKVTVYYNAGQQRGTSTITAAVSNLTVTRQITLLPASSAYITLSTSSNSIPANSDESVTVTALVQDKYFNSVNAGTLVTFTSVDANSNSFGSITPSATTDSLGIARAEFSSGITSGTATIKAVADSANASSTIQVTSNDVTYIQFVNDEQIVLQVQGTGGTESAPLTVNLKDGSGNLIDYNTPVYFTFANEPPTGANINGAVYNYGPSYYTTVMAINGVATIPINSGSGSGTVSVRAYTNTTGTPTQEISATSTSILINAGLPAAASLGIGEYNSGTEFNSGYWRVGITATITDSNGNPVQYGTAVFFSVPDTCSYDWMAVKADAYVGNQSVDGDSLVGTAFSYITYDGSYSNEWVSIQVEVMGHVYVGRLQLPMNMLDLQTSPQWGHIDYHVGPDAPMNGQTLIYCDLADALGNYIHGAYLHAVSTRGLFGNPPDEYHIAGFFYSDNEENANAQNYFVVTNNDGHAEFLLICKDDEVIADPPPGEQDVQLMIYVQGTDISDECSTTLVDYED
jgi:hypothetical protein